MSLVDEMEDGPREVTKEGTEVTPQEINIAIAEWCGWRLLYDAARLKGVWVHPNHSLNEVPPDFYGDLNAVHEVELKLSPLDHQKFCLFLHKEIMGTMDNFDINGTCNIECISRVVKSKAPQRCEALLRTVGLRKDGGK